MSTNAVGITTITATRAGGKYGPSSAKRLATKSTGVVMAIPANIPIAAETISASSARRSFIANVLLGRWVDVLCSTVAASRYQGSCDDDANVIIVPQAAA